MADQGSWTDEQLRQREADRLALAKEGQDQSPAEQAPIPGFDQPVDTSFGGDQGRPTAPAQSGMNADPYQPPAQASVPQGVSPGSSQPVEPTPAAPAPEQPPPAPAPVPVAPPPLPVSTPAALGADIKTEDASWANDLKNGHITPETYESLFAKKDTLGKIGTIFGLMLSGAGSGLTHQPNAMLEMMNKQISNDLDAQRMSKENARNYLRLNLDHQMQQANIKHLDYTNALTQAQTGQVPIQSEHLKAQARALNAESALKADALTRMQMNRVALQALVKHVQSLPQGSPERAAAEQQLGFISNSVDNENYSIADRAAAKAALGNAIMGAGAPAASGQSPAQMNPEEEQWQQNQKFLRMSGHKDMADDSESKHIPGIAGQASVALSSADRDHIQSGQALMASVRELQDFTKKNAGSLNPKVIAEGRTLAAQVAGQFRQATHGGVYKEGEQNFINRIIPEDPSQFLPDMRTLPKLKSVYDETQARTNQFVKSKGFSGLPKQAEEDQYKTVGGVKYKRGPNGEAIKVK